MLWWSIKFIVKDSGFFYFLECDDEVIAGHKLQ